MAHIQALTTDDILKLKAITLYIVNKCGVADIFHILKILYFADRAHYAEWGTRLSEDTFCAMDNGPVASHLYNALKDVTGKEKLPAGSPLKIISDSLYQADPMFEYYISAREEADMDELSASDIACLDRSIAENKEQAFGELSKRSHDQAWQEAYGRKKNAPMNPLLMAEAGGASKETLEFIKENAEFDQMIAK
ncbi:Panacea domain-containing protein [Bacteroides ndongoniae]|uniref:Panacea domain-containing protein n=1 Tax=Bacteroides ndongoniae TaxID=1903262 RepID=UPI0023F98CE6|nr:Panacea domain-containing protein [Bacteroides ndongoniae]